MYFVKRDKYLSLKSKSEQIEVCRGQTETALIAERLKARSEAKAGLNFCSDFDLRAGLYLLQITRIEKAYFSNEKRIKKNVKKFEYKTGF